MGALGTARIALLASVALAGLAAQPAEAVDGIWLGAGNEWTAGTNWSSNPTVPDNIATFQNNGAPTAIDISSTASINTMQFVAGAPAYSFTVGNGTTFTINTSINNSSAFAPAFQVDTGATLLLLKGVHPKIVQERMGHATIAMTLDLYSHVLPSMQQAAVTALDAVWAEQRAAAGD